jgi:NAD+ synthase (glutamine-hydrolysing)
VDGHHGFVRIGAAVPSLAVADCATNADRIVESMAQAEAQRVAVLVLPELAITGYTCADLFHQATLQRGALEALARVAARGGDRYSGLAVVGVPVAVDDQLFNCAAVLHRGRILGLVPKSFIPNYKEFYEGRWFAAAATARSARVTVCGQDAPFGTSCLFEADGVDGLVVGVEICEDVWVPIPPSSYQALAGATVLVNLSASNELIGKAAYRKQLVVNQSARCMAAYAYASCGPWESTTDVVFGGHALVAENGTLLAESRRFAREPSITIADVDLDRLRVERLRTNSFGDARMYQDRDSRPFARIRFPLERGAPPGRLAREVDGRPFVPRAGGELAERCQDIFQTQVAGLARRLEQVGASPPLALGVSGGLDSTLALLVTCRTLDLLGRSRDRLRALTLPGYGTTPRTLANARALMRHLGVAASEVDIRELCLSEMRALGHHPFGIDLDGLDVAALTLALQQVPAERRHDLVFENVQARMRTSILMNTGFVIGTGDVSELALGWCTYNADHMSMYNPNASIPKTLVRFLVNWVADNEVSGEARRVLKDIVATEISPELLPVGPDGAPVQSTEGTIGPYELHDFFLFQVLRFGTPPEKILFLARQAKFEREYADDEVRRWLSVFLTRFFAQQYKRSCLPDGPKVGSISLSPRGDWRMPSDATARLWLAWAAGDQEK